MVWTACVVVVALMLFSGQSDAAMMFSPPVNAGAGVNSPFNEGGAALSTDGLTLIFSSNRPGGFGDRDLYFATRSNISSPFGPAVNMGSDINSSLGDFGGTISSDGLEFFFSSTRNSPNGQADLFVSTRATQTDAWAAPVPVANVNSLSDDGSPDISADGLTLYFGSVRAGGPGNYDLWFSTRATLSDPFTEPVLLTDPLSTSFRENGQNTSPDHLTLYFDSTRPGGVGTRSIWSASRSSTSDMFSNPISLGTTINSAYTDSQPILSRDGTFFMFQSDRPGGFGGSDIWLSYTVPEPSSLTLLGMGIATFFSLRLVRGR